jgi:hypothetical protein
VYRARWELSEEGGGLAELIPGGRRGGEVGPTPVRGMRAESSQGALSGMPSLWRMTVKRSHSPRAQKMSERERQ